MGVCEGERPPHYPRLNASTQNVSILSKNKTPLLLITHHITHHEATVHSSAIVMIKDPGPAASPGPAQAPRKLWVDGEVDRGAVVPLTRSLAGVRIGCGPKT